MAKETLYRLKFHASQKVPRFFGNGCWDLRDGKQFPRAVNKEERDELMRIADFEVIEVIDPEPKAAPVKPKPVPKSKSQAKRLKSQMEDKKLK